MIIKGRREICFPYYLGNYMHNRYKLYMEYGNMVVRVGMQ